MQGKDSKPTIIHDQEKTEKYSPNIDISVKLLHETEETSMALLQELAELKNKLIPNLNQDLSVISLEDALAMSRDGEADDSDNEEGFDWEAKHKARSRIAIESSMLSSQLREINDEISNLEREMRIIKYNQESRRSENEYLSSRERKKVLLKINRKIKAVFLGAREYLEGFDKKEKIKKIETLKQSSIEIESQLEIVKEAGRNLYRELSEQFESKFEEKIKNSVSVWRDYTEAVNSSEWVSREVTERYVQKRILPVLQEVIDQYDISTELKDQFLSNLYEFLQARRIGDSDKIKELWEKLREQSDIYHKISPELLDWKDNRIDLDAVGNITAHLAYEQIILFFQKEIDFGLNPILKDRLFKILKSQLQPDQSEKAREVLKVWKVQPFSSKQVEFDKNIEAFHLIRDSETAKILYGPLLKEFDLEIYKDVLKKSLKGNLGSIGRLYYYPTPDAIKLLVIRAAADSEIWRTKEANNCLARLAKTDSWELLLNHASESIPEIAQLHTLLVNWDHREIYNHPDIKNSANSLAMRVLHDESEPEQLRTLAEDALSNLALVAELVKKDLIDEESFQFYKKAYSLLHSLANQDTDLSDKSDSQSSKLREFEDHLYNWEKHAREIIQQISRVGKEGENYPQLLENFHLLVHLGKLWLEAQNDIEKLDFLSSHMLIEALRPQENREPIQVDQLTFVSESLEKHPVLKRSKKNVVIKAFSYAPDYYITQEGFEFLQQFVEVYSELDYSNFLLDKIIADIADGRLSQSRALELPYIAPDLMNHSLASQYPGIFMVDIELGRNFLNTYNGQVVEKMTEHIVNGDITLELALIFKKIVPSIFGEKEESLRNYIFEQGKHLAQNESDLNFLKEFIGKHGGQSLQLLKEYVACVEDGVVTNENRDKVLEFTLMFRGLSPAIVEGYLAADKAGFTEGYIAELKQMAEKLVSSKSLSEKERSKPYYHGLIRAVYPHNSGAWTSYESNDSCSDRSSDIENFTYEQKYKIDLLSSSEIRVKQGMTIDFENIDSLKRNILDVAEEMESKVYNLEQLKSDLIDDIEAKLSLIQSEGGLEDIDITQLENLDEKIFLLLVDSIFGTRQVDAAELKRLILRYEFSFFDDIRDYIQGTTDRVSQANNQDYALMCELHSFFADRIKEINRRVVKVGWANESIRAVIPKYFTQLSGEKAVAQTTDQLNRLRVDRLGLSDSFINQIGRTLEGRRGKKYSKEQIIRLITLYESLTDGLADKTTISEKDEGDKTERKKNSTRENTRQAFYGQLRSQRTKTLDAIETITGEKFEAQDFHLGNVNLKDLAVSVAGIDAGVYDEEQFQAFTTQRFINLFSDEKNLLESELDKFESESGQQRQVVNGFVTKSKESANARMVGGVCVSGDNPVDRNGASSRESMWNEPNFFQFVLQDPESHRCQGLVMLHHFEENGKKVLTASFNPSSTYLYSVDETSLFEGMMRELEKFAAANDFDMITMSQNETIRTNRTHGGFEKAMDTRRQKIDKTFTFAKEKRFSYQPGYLLKEMDVIWEKV